METRHLIDGIVRQTTIPIAELSTTAGIRAPLSRVADQVFLNLARARGIGIGTQKIFRLRRLFSMLRMAGACITQSKHEPLGA